jgi:hypothetical protein
MSILSKLCFGFSRLKTVSPNSFKKSKDIIKEAMDRLPDEITNKKMLLEEHTQNLPWLHYENNATDYFEVLQSTKKAVDAEGCVLDEWLSHSEQVDLHAYQQQQDDFKKKASLIHEKSHQAKIPSVPEASKIKTSKFSSLKSGIIKPFSNKNKSKGALSRSENRIASQDSITISPSAPSFSFTPLWMPKKQKLSVFPKQSSSLSSASIASLPGASPEMPHEMVSKVQEVLCDIDLQIQDVSSSDIGQLVKQNFPASEEAEAIQAMQHLTQFGNMKSLNHLQEELHIFKRDGYEVCSTGEGTLASSMHYLSKKSNRCSTSPFVHSAIDIAGITTRGKGAILIDQNVLYQLKNNKKLLEHIRNNDFKILYVDGWAEGLNPFNQTSLEILGIKAREAIDRAKALQSKVSLNFNEALKQTISRPMLDEVEGLGINKPVHILHNQTRLTTDIFYDANEVAKNLATDKMSQEELTGILDKFSDIKYKETALDLLKRETQIFSPRRLARAAEKKQLAIEAFAQKKNIPQENIYYYIPKTGKSYGIVSMQHQIVNGISPRQIVTGVKQVPSDHSMIVILDDVAGSGNSLMEVYDDIKEASFPGPVVISPTISTTIAQKAIAKEIGDCIQYIPGEVITSPLDSLYFKSLPHEQQDLQAMLMGSLGFDSNGLCVAFPYMAPDNNNVFFAKNIASKFTLNGEGVKGDTLHYDFC